MRSATNRARTPSHDEIAIQTAVMPLHRCPARPSPETTCTPGHGRTGAITSRQEFGDANCCFTRIGRVRKSRPLLNFVCAPISSRRTSLSLCDVSLRRRARRPRVAAVLAARKLREVRFRCRRLRCGITIGETLGTWRATEPAQQHGARNEVLFQPRYDHETRLPSTSAPDEESGATISAVGARVGRHPGFWVASLLRPPHC